MRAQEVHVWYAAPTQLLDRIGLDIALRWLTPDEQHVLGQFRFERDRSVYLATRALVRSVLSNYHPFAPERWRFARDDYGKPSVVGIENAPSFNLSNTDGMVVCAVARGGQVGVDAETVAASAPLEVAEHVFAETECSELAALEPELQRDRFFELWTLKESYLKARGVGLSGSLKTFWFSFSQGTDPTFHSVDETEEGRWQFAQRRLDGSHLAAVCVSRSGGGEADILWWPA